MDCPQCVDEYETGGAHLEGWSAAAAAAAAGWTAPAYVQKSIPLGRILGWDTHYDSDADGYYGGFW